MIDSKVVLLSLFISSSTLAASIPRGLEPGPSQLKVSATIIAGQSSQALVHQGGKSYWVPINQAIPGSSYRLLQVGKQAIVIENGASKRFRLDLGAAPNASLAKAGPRLSQLTDTTGVSFGQILRGSWYARSGRAKGMRIFAKNQALFARAALKSGDVIVAIDGNSFTNKASAEAAFKQLQSKDMASLEVYRSNRSINLSVDLRSI